MYQKIGVVLVIVCLFVSCKKKDIIFGKPGPSRCEIEQIDGPFMQIFPLTGVAKKTFYDDGLVKSLEARAFYFLGVSVDSIKCTFTYSQNVAHVKEQVVEYNLELEPMDGTISGPGGYNPDLPSDLEYDVILDPQTGYATSAGDMQFAYKNGRLQSYTIGDAVYEFQYDSNGNLVKEGLAGSKQTYWRHEYDQSKTAQHQFYPLARVSGHERYLVLQMLGWLPPMQKNLRRITHYMLSEGLGPNEDYQFTLLRYDNHTVDKNGFLLSYVFDGIKLNTEWKCTKASPVKGK